MRSFSLALVCAIVAATSSSAAQNAGGFHGAMPGSGRVNGYNKVADVEGRVVVELTGASGWAFALFASPVDPTYGPVAWTVGLGWLDPSGAGSIEYLFEDLDNQPDGFAVSAFAVYAHGGFLHYTDIVTIPLTAGASPTIPLDFDHAFDEEILAGTTLDDQWSPFGMAISAQNNAAGHPDKAIAFDSENPTGWDFDLQTPGFGIGNDEALGKLLILAENDIDSDGDGLVDDPDDEGQGGTVRFDFADPIAIHKVTLVDIDDSAPTELAFEFAGAAGGESMTVEDAGENGVREVFFVKNDVTRMDVRFAGSGGIAGLEVEPCPLVAAFDYGPTGIDTGLETGMVLEGQMAELGFEVSAVNNTAGHPNKVVLFDTGNPTGGDFDLQTPGWGANNDEPLGKVLIIAEDDVDADGDGLIDDPDDEGGGGKMVFEFVENVRFYGATILDVDSPGANFFEAFDASGASLGTFDIPQLGDNSVEEIVANPPINAVRRLELNLSGSGAVARLRYCR